MACRTLRIRALVPEVKLFVVGHSPPARVKALGREAGIEVTGYVSDILIAAFQWKSTPQVAKFSSPASGGEPFLHLGKGWGGLRGI
jgi:hypothetical protein